MTDAPQNQPRDPDGPHGAMTFREHLVELRSRVLKASLAVIVAFFVAWSFHVELYAFVSAPVREALANNNLFAIKALQITESIEVYMRLSLVGGLFLASPFVFYQLWAFVAPGLLREEKRLVVPVVGGSVACFFLGAAFCYLVVLPFMTDFLIKLTVDAPGMTLEPTLASTVSFSLLMLLAFGAVFELPLFMYVLAALGLVTAKGFLGFFRYWTVIAFVIGAILTPTPDPINQTLMSAPLVVLYAIGVGIAWFAQRQPGQVVPRRTIVAVAGVAMVVAIAGVAYVAREQEPGPLDDVPADVHQVLGVHSAAMRRLQQEAEAHPVAAEALAPLTLVDALGLRPLADPVAILVRFDGAAAVLVQVPDAEKAVRRLAKQRQVSVVASPSGPSAWFALDGVRWRMVAAGRRGLWLGHDEAVERLSAVRRGQVPGLMADPAVAERVTALRSSAPVWSLVPGDKGLAGWLPGGALTSHVRWAAAVLPRDKAELTLRFDCKGPEAAVALRDRIDTWIGDSRKVAPQGNQDLAMRLASERLKELAELVARTSQASARLLPAGSADHATLLSAGEQAARMARELNATPAAPIAPAPATGPLQAMVQPPAVTHAEAQGTAVTWTIQGEAPLLLATLAAPARGGLDPATVRALLAPKAGEDKAPRAGGDAARPGTTRRPGAPAEVAPPP